MKKFTALLIPLLLPMVQYGQIVADHTVVDQYDAIPQQYIDVVKTMLVCMAGESHSMGYQNGQLLLEMLDPTYQVETYDSDPPPAYTDQYLRIGKPYMMGEDGFFSPSGLDNIKQAVAYQNDTGNPFDVMGFVWCWDMTWENPPGGTMDPVYRVRWAGSSEGSPDGNKRWGLDRGDSILTGNRVNMDTYLEGVDALIRYCGDMHFPTQWVYTTGPVDGEEENGSEMGFQREIKHDYIRSFVAADASRILFDYADILCWNNDGEKNMAEWNDNGEIRPHAQIHPDNLMDYDEAFNIIDMNNDSDGDHIGEVGALRLAKAMWWMLARIAGWEGSGGPTGKIETDKADSSVHLFIGNDYIRIEVQESLLNGQIALYQLDGRLVDKRHISASVSYMDTSSMASGYYLVVLTKDRLRELKNIVIL
jgi:hypothetical protein